MKQTTGRIGIVMPLGLQQGGAEALLMHLLRHGRHRFQFLCVFLQDGPLLEQVRSMGYPADLTPTTHISDPVDYLRTVLWLRAWIRREQPDAVVSWMAKAHLYVAPAAVLLDVKTVWFQHGIARGEPIDRIITLLPADNVFCCSAASKAAQDQIRPKRHTSVCYPGVPFPVSAPIPASQARDLVGLPRSARIVGMVARLERWKGVHVFVQAARIAFAAEPATYFFIVGGAHPRDLAYAEEVRTMAANSGLGDHLILTDQQPASEVPLWQASADIMVHSVTGAEPFGLAVVEAMGMGKTVVASDAGGLREIIQDGVNGFLVAPGDANTLGRKLIDLLRLPEELALMGASAFIRGRSFSVSRFAARVDELIAETLVQ